MQTLTNRESKTLETLTAMFTENTGRHLLDSGGAYGRNWERNQGLTVADFQTAPSASWSRDWGVTVDAWHLCADRLTYSKTAEVLTRLMHVWELKDYDNRDLYNLGDQEEFLETMGAEKVNGWNSYNWDTNLSQTLQAYDFELMGQTFTLLQVHGGCDVRGGYTLPVIFEACCEYWIHGGSDFSIWCDPCNMSANAFDLGNWWQYGDLGVTLFGEPDREFYAPENWQLEDGCPKCGGDLTAEASECGF